MSNHRQRDFVRVTESTNKLHQMEEFGSSSSLASTYQIHQKRSKLKKKINDIVPVIHTGSIVLEGRSKWSCK